jgi:photosystem II stability/assembly factor-like uncharacterized protein
VNNDYGWIAGTNGTVFKTTNGGEDWQSLKTNYNGTITKIFFIDENNGWAFNTEGTFLITNDGGFNWKSQNLSTGILAMSFISKDIGWLASTTKGILKTTDGGSTWNSLTSNQNIYREVYFYDSLNGFAGGGGLGVVKTTDGGNTWYSVFAKSPTGSMYFVNKNYGWLTDYNGDLYKTTNSGENWSLVSSVSGPIYFYDQQHGWILTDSQSKTLYSDDGGSHWKEQAPKGYFNDIFFASNKSGWMVGNNGVILRTNNYGEIDTSKYVAELHWQNPRPTSELINSIWFVNESSGWFCANNGQLFKTTNSGIDWNQVDLNTNKNLIKIQFVSPNDGYILSSDNILYSTTDGGDKWESKKLLDDPHASGAIDFEFYNKNVGWFLISNSLRKTLDGGKTLTLMTGRFNDGANTIDVVDSANVWIAGGNATLLRTTDAGLTWQDLHNGYIDPYLTNSVYFKSITEGWVFGHEYTSTCTYTSDSGITWSNYRVNNEVPNQIYFLNNNTGWALINGDILYKTNNGGTDWTYMGNVHFRYATNEHLFFLNENVIFSGNDNLYKTTDSGINWQSLGKGERGNLNAVDFSDSLNGVAVGEKGLTIYTNNGGKDWLRGDSTINFNLNAVSFADKNNCWAAGDSGRIYKSSNGGKNWISQASNYSSRINSLSFVDNKNGWANGIRTTDGGINWTPYDTGTEGPFEAIYFISQFDGWMVSRDGQILKTSDGGETWEDENSRFQYEYDLYSVFFLDDSTGWNCGGGGLIAKTTDGGKTWETQHTDQNTLYQIKFINSSYGFAVGSREDILFTNDGGRTWNNRVITSDFAPVMKSIALIDTNNIWLAGSRGTIIKSKLIPYNSQNSDTSQGGNNNGNTIPTDFILYQNYPNPFNPSTRIDYSIPRSSFVTLKVYDILGREAATLVNEEKPAGNYEVEFNGSNLSSGVYFYRIEAESFVSTKKLVLLK